MSIFINQVGYLINGIKHATVTLKGSYSLFHQNGEKVWETTVDTLISDANSGDLVATIDFSEIKESGIYYIQDLEGNRSASFSIGNQVYENVFCDALRMFYFQRCGMDLEEKYAGVYAHKACHTDKVTLLENRNKTLQCNGGWHDAGDYGRYVTAGAVAVAHLLYAYDIKPDAFVKSSNIPESGNGIADVLNECRYELDWILKMQREDGAVYHKLTSLRHTDFVMPQEDPLPFYITPVSSLATADFAAVCALASRIYKEIDNGYSECLKKAAIKAYDWLVNHPAFLFENPKECQTGAYDDMSDADERMWALVEMYRLTGNENCLNQLNCILELQVCTTALGWNEVGGFASLAILSAPQGTFDEILVSRFRQKWLDEADRLMKVSTCNAFEIAMHPYDFKWGSNMVVLNYAVVLMYAYTMTNDEAYKQAGGYQLDYILGRNALNVSYVTGHGERAFTQPHNRPTIVDGIDAPIPGYVSGGPNRQPCDPDALKAIPSGTAPMKCFVDDWRAYSTNEITIYWNSIFVLALSWLM